jgi:hypothetical protein
MHLKILAFLLLFSSPLLAQEGYEHLSPLSHGAGRTYVVNSRGLDAVGLNPALLALGSKRTWELSVFPFSALGADAGASFLSDKLTQLANNTADLDSGKHGDALDLLRNNGFSGRGDVRVLGAYYHDESLGGFAFTFTTHSGIRTQIPSQALDFLDNFVKFGNQVVNIDDIDAQGLWYNSWSFSYGRKLIKSESFSFTAGAAVKYIQGLGYLRLEEGAYLRSRPLTQQRIDLEVNYSLRYAFIDVFDRTKSQEDISLWDIFGGAAGSGVGFDLGTAMTFGGDEKKPGFILGASVNDIGAITWTENTIERKADHVRDTISYQQVNDKTITDSLSALAGVVTRPGSFTTNLPTTLRIGAALNFKQLGVIPVGPEIVLAAELTTGLTSVVGSLDDARIGVGAIAEWDFEVMTLRTAAGVVSEGDVLDITFGLGTTIADYVSLDISSARLGQVLGAGEARSDLAIGVKVHL